MRRWLIVNSHSEVSKMLAVNDNPIRPSVRDRLNAIVAEIENSDTPKRLAELRRTATLAKDAARIAECQNLAMGGAPAAAREWERAKADARRAANVEMAARDEVVQRSTARLREVAAIVNDLAEDASAVASTLRRLGQYAGQHGGRPCGWSECWRPVEDAAVRLASVFRRTPR